MEAPIINPPEPFELFGELHEFSLTFDMAYFLMDSVNVPLDTPVRLDWFPEGSQVGTDHHELRLTCTESPYSLLAKIEGEEALIEAIAIIERQNS